MFIYCPICGYIIKKYKNDNCPVCENSMIHVPDSYLSASKNMFLSPDVRKQFIDEIILTNPMYDKVLAGRRDEILKEQEHRLEI